MCHLAYSASFLILYNKLHVLEIDRQAVVKQKLIMKVLFYMLACVPAVIFGHRLRGCERIRSRTQAAKIRSLQRGAGLTLKIEGLSHLGEAQGTETAPPHQIKPFKVVWASDWNVS